MSKPDKMPTPFRHKKFGTYYLKKRVPQDIKHLWHPFSRFVYGRISENYRRVFERPIKEVSEMPIR